MARQVPALDQIMYDEGKVAPLKYVAVAATADGDNTIIAAVAGKKLRIVQAFLTSTTTGLVGFKNGAGSTVFSIHSLAGSGQPMFPNVGWVMETSVNTAFILNTTAGQDVHGFVVYAEVES